MPVLAESNQSNAAPDLEVVVPALNEERRIGLTIDALATQLEDMPIDARLRVIDNGSADRTADVVDRVGARHSGVEVTVEGCSRPGKGQAVARGVLTSRARWVGYCDADLATPAAAVSEAVSYLSEGWKVVVGSRHLPDSKLVVDQPFSRRVGGAGFRLAARALAGDLKVADTQCGFKFFDSEVAHRIFPELVTGGFAFDVDVLRLARDLGVPIKEFPVEWTDREGSTFRAVRHGPQVTAELWRIRRQRRQRTAAFE